MFRMRVTGVDVRSCERRVACRFPHTQHTPYPLLCSTYCYGIRRTSVVVIKKPAVPLCAQSGEKGRGRGKRHVLLAGYRCGLTLSPIVPFFSPLDFLSLSLSLACRYGIRRTSVVDIKKPAVPFVRPINCLPTRLGAIVRCLGSVVVEEVSHVIMAWTDVCVCLSLCT